MNSRLFKTAVLAVIILGGIWILSKRDEIREPGDVVQLVKQRLSAIPAGYPSEASSDQPKESIENVAIHPPTQWVTNVIRIASFSLDPASSSAGADDTLDSLVAICLRYDVIALQNIGEGGNRWLARLADRINRTANTGFPNNESAIQNQAEYSFISEALEPRPGSQDSSSHSAIVFNCRTVQLDQTQRYVINDPDGLLSRTPMVGCFRALGPSSQQAFTFTLVNMTLDSNERDSGLENLDDLFRAIRDDGRGEDDVLVVGNFRAGKRELAELRKESGLTGVVSNRPMNTVDQTANLVLNPTATVEHTGRGGVLDFMRRFNLRLEDSLRLSAHMPVWAEFSVVEGNFPVSEGNFPNNEGNLPDSESKLRGQPQSKPLPGLRSGFQLGIQSSNHP